MYMINFGGIITTYRCNSKCHFCNIWKYPSNIKEEIKVESYEKLPFIKTVNITGGEPFLREDLDDIVRIIKKKSNRIIISSNGLDTEKITKFFDKHRNVGIRISIEGLPRINDSIRGQNHNFDNSMRTLLELSLRKIKDIGIAITISNRNICDLTLICQLANMIKIDFFIQKYAYKLFEFSNHKSLQFRIINLRFCGSGTPFNSLACAE